MSIEPYPTPNIVEQDLLGILEKVYFVDKIIFGKLNYNVKSSKFKDNEAFYKKCADKVVEFCEERGIKYHIKFGTRKEYDVGTEVIFRKSPEIIVPQRVVC